MKFKRKYSLIVMTLALLFGIFIGKAQLASAKDNTQFTDLHPNDAHYDNIIALVEKGVIHGYSLPDGTTEFRPNVQITRAQTAQLLVNALNLPIPSDVNAILKNFKDMDSSSYYAKAIAASYQANIFNGSNGYFNDGPLTREQMATVLVNAFHLPETTGTHKKVNLSNVDSSHKVNVQILADYGITNQLNDFQPINHVSRAQFASFLNLSIDAAEKLKTGDIQPSCSSNDPLSSSGADSIKDQLSGYYNNSTINAKFYIGNLYNDDNDLINDLYNQTRGTWSKEYIRQSIEEALNSCNVIKKVTPINAVFYYDRAKDNIIVNWEKLPFQELKIQFPSDPLITGQLSGYENESIINFDSHEEFESYKESILSHMFPSGSALTYDEVEQAIEESYVTGNVVKINNGNAAIYYYQAANEIIIEYNNI